MDKPSQMDGAQHLLTLSAIILRIGLYIQNVFIQDYKRYQLCPHRMAQLGTAIGGWGRS